MLLQAAKDPGSSAPDDGQDSGDNSGVEDPDQEPAEDGNGEPSGKRLMQLKSRHINKKQKSMVRHRLSLIVSRQLAFGRSRKPAQSCGLGKINI